MSHHLKQKENTLHVWGGGKSSVDLPGLLKIFLNYPWYNYNILRNSSQQSWETICYGVCVGQLRWQDVPQKFSDNAKFPKSGLVLSNSKSNFLHLRLKLTPHLMKLDIETQKRLVYMETSWRGPNTPLKPLISPQLMEIFRGYHKRLVHLETSLRGPYTPLINRILKKLRLVHLETSKRGPYTPLSTKKQKLKIMLQKKTPIKSWKNSIKLKGKNIKLKKKNPTTSTLIRLPHNLHYKTKKPR